MSQVEDVLEVPDLYHLRRGLPLEEIRERVGVAYAGAGLRHRVVCFYLQEVDCRKLYQLAGFGTTARWAARCFGMSRREARDLLAAGQALLELPQIDEAFAQGRLCWSKVRLLVRVATPEHEGAWLKRALETAIDEFTLEVKLARRGQAPRNRDDRKGLPEVRLRVEALVPPDVYAKRERAIARLHEEAGRLLEEWECLEAMYDLVLAMPHEGETAVTENSPYTVIVNTCACCGHDGDDQGAHATVETEDGPIAISPLTAGLVACDGKLVEASSRNGLHKDHVTDALRRRVLARDHYRCRCCRSRVSLQNHHIVFESDGGPTVLENLLTVCWRCHTLVHAGLLRIEGDPGQDLRFLDREGMEIGGVETVPMQAVNRLAGLLPEPYGPETSKLALPTCQELRGVGTMCQPAPRRGAERLDDLVGQEQVREVLRDSVRVAAERDEPIGHTLLTGPPGLGKTTMACAVAAELGVEIHALSAPILESPADLLSVVRRLGRRDILFIDEIHALPRRVAETLYEAMDRTHFTLIGATTEPGTLPEPFLSRFEIVEHLDFYKPCDLATLVAESATRQGLAIDASAALRLAEVARGTPRRALQLLRRCRTGAIADGRCGIDRAIVERTLDKLGIDELGLDRIDRRYLEILRSRGSGRPISLARLAAMLGMDAEALRRLHEPYLFRLGLIATTPAGRIAVAA